MKSKPNIGMGVKKLKKKQTLDTNEKHKKNEFRNAVKRAKQILKEIKSCSASNYRCVNISPNLAEAFEIIERDQSQYKMLPNISAD